jgi:hypothetical protein
MGTEVRCESILMGHLRDIGLNYFEHLCRAWSLAFVCIVHGLFPTVWEHKAKDIINGDPQDYKVKKDVE